MRGREGENPREERREKKKWIWREGGTRKDGDWLRRSKEEESRKEIGMGKY
jgi:hypothetical protein